MLTINEIRIGLEDRKILVGRDLTNGTEIKACLDLDEDIDSNEAIWIKCLEGNVIQWGSVGVTYSEEFEGCSWFTSPDYIWETISK